jgi:cell division protein FtsI/penicillin-binding protein 2
VPYVIGLLLILVLAGAAAVAYTVHERRAADDRRRGAAREFVAAWVKRDRPEMWKLVSAASRRVSDYETFERGHRMAEEAAGVERIVAGRPGALRDGTVRVRVRFLTRDFGTLSGTYVLKTHDENGRGTVDWTPAMRLPGLREDEDVRRQAGPAPSRGEVLAADGSRLADDPIGAGIAGTPRSGRTPPTGLERLYEKRLIGHPAQTLNFGSRVIRKIDARRGRSVHTTIRLGLTRTAQAALGDKVGGVAVIRPRDGAVLALGGLAVSAPQPPGSTFKIVTLAAALQNGIASPSSSYPVATHAVLSGVKLRNAGDEACGGGLPKAFADSCNSVFAPLGAKLGARRLLAAAERFGFNEQPRIPAAKPSTVAKDLRDGLAVGSAAIGQERDLATPLQMASVGATIANRGVRVRPRVVREDPIVRRRVVRSKVAAQVRDMMIGVVQGGTGRAGGVPGVIVAGKTGTAELRPTASGPPDPKNTDAWFVAFAPAGRPTVAVAVMLVGAGHGGATAAPVARRVLQAAL